MSNKKPALVYYIDKEALISSQNMIATFVYKKETEGTIPVIEMSAYQILEAKCAELEKDIEKFVEYKWQLIDMKNELVAHDLRNAELQKDIEKYKASETYLLEQNELYFSELQTERAKTSKLVEALKFYADTDNYDTVYEEELEGDVGRILTLDDVAFDDGKKDYGYAGYRARQVLAEIENDT